MIRHELIVFLSQKDKRTNKLPVKTIQENIFFCLLNRFKTNFISIPSISFFPIRNLPLLPQ